MDKTDLKIIEILQKNGRISFKNLGNEVGLTSPAVSERIKRLEENGVILGYKAIINPEKINKNIQAFIHASIEGSKVDKFLSYADSVDAIIECYHVTGGNSMTLKVIVQNMEQLKTIIDNIKKMGNTQTSVILSSPLKDKIIL